MPLGAPHPGRCRSFDPLPAGRTRPVPMLADVVEAVVGIDTHRDTHEVEIASPNGVPIARCSIRNDSTGYAQLLAWIVDHAPGPRLAVSIEGSRSYGVGLSRALSAAGLQAPRVDGDREALRILLGARHDLTVASTAQTNRLRALLLDGDDTDRDLARGALTDAVLTDLAGRQPAI